MDQTGAEYFCIFSPLRDFRGQDLSNKNKNRSLFHAIAHPGPGKFCRESTYFFKKRDLLLAPSVYRKLLAFVFEIFKIA
jgi:hypothetical protein